VEKRTELLFLRAIILILLIFGLLLIGKKVFGETAATDPQAAYTVIDADELEFMMAEGDCFIVNVSFRCNGYIPGTDWEIPFNLIDHYWDFFPEPGEAKIILYCNGGFMSRVAARRLLSVGYTEVYVLRGGLKQWELEGRPVVGRTSR
jgi:rhodanese-related sulfurtransferase